jgi:hypothetical protein
MHVHENDLKTVFINILTNSKLHPYTSMLNLFQPLPPKDSKYKTGGAVPHDVVILTVHINRSFPVDGIAAPS